MKLKTWLDSARGRTVRLARAIDVPSSFVSNMANGKKVVPSEKCIQIERFTGGAVTCEELRPDLAADFAYLRGAAAVVTADGGWPELAQASAGQMAVVVVENVAAGRGA